MRRRLGKFAEVVKKQVRKIKRNSKNGTLHELGTGGGDGVGIHVISRACMLLFKYSNSPT